MVGPGDIIANGLGGVAAEEYRAGMADPLGQRIGLVEREFGSFTPPPSL